MALNEVSDLALLWEERMMSYGQDHLLMDRLISTYNGELDPEFADYFHADMHVHLPNLIRLAWDDMASMTGKVFPIYVRPESDTARAKSAAERLEKIGYGWNRAGSICGGVSMAQLKKVVSWWLVGCANAVYMVLPDYDKQTPFFTFRDPRTHYPPVGWSPFTQALPEDTLFAYQMTVAELKNRYPEKRAEISQKFTKTRSTATSLTKMEDTWAVWVGEYFHRDSWFVTTMTDVGLTLARSDDGDAQHPGVMPVVPIGLYNPDGGKGRSIYADQISIQAAMARMFSQKLDFYDRTLYPIIFHTPLAKGTVRLGPYAMNEYNVVGGIQPRLDVVAPARDIDANQMQAFALGLTRMLNRNPEMLQGGGEANSAKALEQLKAGITSTVRDQMWPPMIEAEPRLYSLAAQMDVNCWGNMKKRVKGTRKNNAFTVDYVPSVHLRGHEDDFEVEPGLGLAGYQGTLEIIQLYGAELIPEQDAVEQGEWSRDATEMIRRLQGDKLNKIMLADLTAKAAQGILADGALAEVKQRVLGKGEDMFDVIGELEKAGRLYRQMPQMPGAPGAEAGGMPGILPSMEALRGGR